MKEPEAKISRSKKGELKFVVQKHQASHLHYDFRLELGGVLKSWAVPKGVPLKSGEKHLAIRVEDHSLEYAAFEGTIPEGHYGAGTVEIWDAGTYFLLGAEKLLEEGHLDFVLHGKKLKGRFSLIKMKNQGQKDNWLLIKREDS